MQNQPVDRHRHVLNLADLLLELGNSVVDVHFDRNNVRFGSGFDVELELGELGINRVLLLVLVVGDLKLNACVVKDFNLPRIIVILEELAIEN